MIELLLARSPLRTQCTSDTVQTSCNKAYSIAAGLVDGLFMYQSPRRVITRASYPLLIPTTLTMAGGGIATTAGANVHKYNSRFNFHIVLAAIVGASAGLLFGVRGAHTFPHHAATAACFSPLRNPNTISQQYDIGVTGGVTSMPNFLAEFFPDVHAQTSTSSDPYCQYDSIQLQMFTSSLFFAGMIASLVAIWLNKLVGRRGTMLIASLWFLAGALMTGMCVVYNYIYIAATLSTGYHPWLPVRTGLAFAFWILLLGRICLGVGVGLANQSAPVYLSEIAPAHLRGGMNIMFQLAVTVGILLAQCINLWTSSFQGWHISLLLAGVPAIFLLVGGIFLPDRCACR